MASNRAETRPEGRVGWVEKTLAGITSSIEQAVFTERHARSEGWLQGVDPRAKLGMFLAAILAASFTSSVPALVVLYACLVAAALASRIPLDFYVRRVWVGIPLFAAIVVIPAIFLVPGPRLFELTLGPITIAPSVPGLAGAILFVARVGVSVSVAILLVMVTPWADLLKSLRAIRTPQVFVLILSMTYRYIFLFLHTVNGIFLARKSRIVARTSGAEQRRWISGTIGTVMSRSFKMSNEVYTAMLARGFGGEMRSYNAFAMRPPDWLALAGTVALAGAILVFGRVVG